MLTCGLIILDMNAGNGLAISLSVYLSLSKNDMLKKKTNKTKQNKKQNDQEKRKRKTFPPRVVEPQIYDVKGQLDIHCATATLNVKQISSIFNIQFFAHEILPVDADNDDAIRRPSLH